MTNYDPHPHSEQDFPPKVLGDALPHEAPKSKVDYNGFNPIFLNRFQRLTYNAGGRTTVCACGRATGKTALLGMHQIRLYQSIVRGSCLFGAPSLKSLYSKTQPAMIKSMEQICGHIEGIHFFRGQPPKKLNWPRPLAMPRQFDNVLYAYTGHITYFVSALSVAAGNGYSLSSIIMDETRLVRNFQQSYVESILPALRGEIYDHPGWSTENPLYLSQFLCSDNGVVSAQREWYNHFKKLVTPDINKQIAEMLAELELCPQLAQLPAFNEKLNHLRCQAVTLFTCATAYNEALPPNYLRDMRMQMPPILFSVQIMGNDLEDGVDNEQYYYCFNPEVHLYDKNEWDETNRILGDANRKHKKKDGYGIVREWEAPDLEITASHAEDDYYDVDLDPKLPLVLTFDLNANFNTVVVSQRIPHKNGRMEIRIVKCLYTKYKEKLRALLSKFCGYYAHRRASNRRLIFVQDATLKQGQQYALEDAENGRYADIIYSVLTKAGWDVEIEPYGTPMDHDAKFQLINDMLAGHTKFDIRINKELDFLVLALYKARAIQGHRGTMKDKSKEKLKSESDDSMGQSLETRTDVTDAWDLAVLSPHKAVYGSSPIGTRGVIFSMPTTIM